MILGDFKRIDLGTSSFESMRKDNNLYIDKTKLIEHFLNETNSVQLIVRQRRLGKSLNLDMLRCFLTDRENHRDLFVGTYIESSSVWSQLNSSPVFYFDFKNLKREKYKEQIYTQVAELIYQYIDVEALKGFDKIKLQNYMDDRGENPEGLLLLTELVFKETGKRSYILIDEYDKLLTDNYDSDMYQEIKQYETSFLSAGLKGNRYLKKALLTGVMRVSRESILSDLNNLVTYDVYSDNLYTNDFGLVDSEINELQKYIQFSKSEIRVWYNGIKINGEDIYNIYSVLSCLKNGRIDNYWGRSGTIQIISELMDSSRKEAIIKLLDGETIEVFVSHRISLEELNNVPSDNIFYSLLVQSGYLSLEKIGTNNFGLVKIPNKELMNVWKEFILSSIIKNSSSVKSMFDNINDSDVFSKDIEYFLCDKLSYYDLAENDSKIKEKIYHVFVLGLLSAYEDITYKKPPQSNRESGDGRYDILFERKDFSIIFEFKAVSSVDQLQQAVEEGLKQIDEKRYFADASKDKPLIKTAIAFYGKQCMAKSKNHIW